MPELAKRPRYKVGDQLQPKSRGPRWVGTVSEAQGTYSPNGHVLYRVRVPMDPEPLFLLLREEEVAGPDVLGRFAEEIHGLMDAPKSQDRFRSQCLEYLRQRAKQEDRPPPMDLLAENKADLLTLPEKYALLTALHNVIRGSADKLDPVVKPANLTWEEFADRDFETYKNAVRWEALENRVKEWLGPDYSNNIKSWLDEVQSDLQN